MTWQLIPIRFTYYRPKWKVFILLLALAITILTFIYLSFSLIIKCPSYIPTRLFHRRYVDMDASFQKYTNITWTSRAEDLPLISLFTTWDPTMQKPIVYQNAIQNWHSLSENIQTTVFTNNTKIRKIALKGNWSVLPIKRTACYGTPVLKTMFQDAMQFSRKTKFYGYSNADIVYNDGLVKSLKAISKSDHFSEGPILIVGKRIDVNISIANEPTVKTSEDVDNLVKHGNLSWGFAADFYITNDIFPWHLVPDLVIGRPLVDNWIIWFARQINAKVIDVSPTVLAVHQLAVGLKRIQIRCNKAEMWKSNLLPNLPIYKGMIECASYETRYNSKGNVFVLPKLLLQKTCQNDEIFFHSYNK